MRATLILVKSGRLYCLSLLQESCMLILVKTGTLYCLSLLQESCARYANTGAAVWTSVPDLPSPPGGRNGALRLLPLLHCPPHLPTGVCLPVCPSLGLPATLCLSDLLYACVAIVTSVDRLGLCVCLFFVCLFLCFFRGLFVCFACCCCFC